MQPWNVVYRTFVRGCLWISLNLMTKKWTSCVIGTKQQHSKVIMGNVDVTPVSVARKLGTWFDFNLNLQEQFDKTCKYKFFHLYSMWLIRKNNSYFVSGIFMHLSLCFYHRSYRFFLPSVHLCKLQRLRLLGL